jgi:hypothetical protein
MKDSNEFRWRKLEIDEETAQSPEPTETEVKLITKFKLLDFVLGTVIFGVINYYISGGFILTSGPGDYIGFGRFFFIPMLLCMINISGILYFNYRSKYFMFGILPYMIYPLLLFGSC